MDILFNNQIVSRDSVSIDIEDRGYQFGDGIYEVVSIYNGELFEWEAHLERFVRSAKEIALTLPEQFDLLKENIMRLIEDNHIEEGYAYFQLTRGTALRMHAFPEPQAEPVLTGMVKNATSPPITAVKAITTEDIRWLRVDIKSLNLLPNCMAKQKAVEAGAQEAIFIRDHYVTEASSSNVFGVKNGVLYTHPINNLILNGITRQVVLRLAGNLHYKVVEEAFTRDELMDMDEVFITNTGLNVCPVIEIDGMLIGEGVCGPITSSLMSAFGELIQRNGKEKVYTE
ncbi:D-amino-acid transaminase [Ureibacillus aquaedulcis]|uniref:D-alanine aminotransferase n=1 Tax=Ureibacillus aquaedulcis TaxID=3058421 RepID=A0ABT8GT47_9BACL|nr:D-amino-acid transaminase [Ureibacillus sp. BA0131]MDN4494586.1 D-amino-acid transaminase [Ureibacillus sp. BA0131]